MKGLREKFQKNGGFTLVEMLIVVAIIAILIAVSIPLVSSSLEKTRHATDEANNRSAMALGTVMYLSDYDSLGFTNSNDEKKFTYSVNSAHQGKLCSTTETGYTPVKPACTCSSADASHVLTVTIKGDGTVSTNWTFATDGTLTTTAPSP